jgi:hypothetical protein
MRIGPVTFLLLVPALWAVVRGAILWPERRHVAERAVRWAPPLQKAEAARAAALAVPVVVRSRPSRQFTQVTLAKSVETATQPPPRELGRDAPRSSTTVNVTRPRDAAGLPFVPVAERPAQRFSLSAWLLVRGDTSPGLATAGQLGGSQAGLRARIRVGEGLYAVARVSGPLRSRFGKEGAIGLDVRPIASIPVTVIVERRIGLDQGGRDAFGIGAFGGFDRRVATGLRLDGYGQAGVVGLRRRDAYVDGALRAERSLTRHIGVGAGLWGGAQPGAARLDVGPQLVVHTGRFRIAAEWRQRVAGDARPGSGPVLSLGADF